MTVVPARPLRSPVVCGSIAPGREMVAGGCQSSPAPRLLLAVVQQYHEIAAFTLPSLRSALASAPPSPRSRVHRAWAGTASAVVPACPLRPPPRLRVHCTQTRGGCRRVPELPGRCLPHNGGSRKSLPPVPYAPRPPLPLCLVSGPIVPGRGRASALVSARPS
jgi:hypothetical protein